MTDTGLTLADRPFLEYALDLAEDRMVTEPEEFGPGDWDSLRKLRRAATELPPHSDGHTA